MNHIFVADIHIGNHKAFGGRLVGGLNERCTRAIRTLERALRLTAERKATCVILGDLFDTAALSPPIVAAVMDVIERFERVPVIIILGNHDQGSDDPGDHACGPLEYLPNVRILSSIGCDEELLLLAYQKGDAREWLPPLVEKEVRSRACTTKVLGLHLGLIGDTTPPWLHHVHDAIEIAALHPVMKACGIEVVIAGNWHDTRSTVYDGITYIQCGTLCPTGFDNPGGLTPGRYGSVWHLSRTDRSRHEVPGPRFVLVEGEAALALAARQAKEAGHDLYVTWAVAPDQIPDALRVASGFPDVRARVVGALSEQPSDLPAHTPTTRDEALVEYVRKTSPPEIVNDVLTTARDLLR